MNSGFETDTPQLVVPMKLATELGLYYRLTEARIESYGTPGGPIRMYVLPEIIEVWIEETDLKTRAVVADAVISEIEAEVLIREDPSGKVRRSYQRQLWIQRYL